MSGSAAPVANATTAAAALGVPPPAAAAPAANLLSADPGPQGLMQTVSRAYAQKKSEQAPVVRQMEEQQVADKLRFDKAAEGYEPVKSTPPPKAPESDPLKAFGSVAGIFAMIASKFTHTPMISAMNGMANVINSAKDADWEKYQSSYREWKDNTELAIRNHKLQAEDMRLAMETMTSDLSLSKARLDVIASQTDDAILAAKTREGAWEDIQRLSIERSRLALEAQRNAIAAQEHLPKTEGEFYERLSVSAAQNLERAKAAVAAKPNDPAAMAALDEAQKRLSDLEARRDSVSTRESLARAAGTVAGSRMADSKAADEAEFKTRFNKDYDPSNPEDAGKMHDLRVERANREAAEKARAMALARQTVLTPAAYRDTEVKIGIVSESLDAIDRIINLMPEDKTLGTIFTYPAARLEAFGNSIGLTDKTVRSRFIRDIDYLKLQAPTILRGANTTSRSIAGDINIVNKLIPQGHWGDSQLNAKEAFESMRKILINEYRMMEDQLNSTPYQSAIPTPSTPAAGVQPVAPQSPVAHDPPVVAPAPPAAPNSAAPWLNDEAFSNE